MSPAKIIGDQGHVRNDPKSLNCKGTQTRLRGGGKAGSNWIRGEYRADRLDGGALLPPRRGGIRLEHSQDDLFQCAFRCRNLPLSYLWGESVIFGACGTLTYFQEQNLFTRHPQERSLLPRSFCPAVPLPAPQHSAQSTPCLRPSSCAHFYQDKHIRVLS